MNTRRARRSRRSTGRILGFVGLTIACVVAAVAYLLVSDSPAREQGVQRVAQAPRSSLRSFADEPHLLFRTNGRGPGYGRVAVTPLRAAGGPRALTSLRCERVAFAHGVGMCLTDESGITITSGLDIFDARFRVRHHIGLPGIVSRARVAPNGKVGAATVFVSGDSYASDSFSTRTNFFDLVKGRIIGDLEKFRVTRRGAVVDRVDRNFWGVTFAKDSNTFYATLGTSAHNYLIKGNLKQRTARVIHSEVECPALSPDGLRIAYKHRERGEVVAGIEQAATWRLHVLDLRTGHDVALAERRNVDDQPVWLDDATVGYAIPHAQVNVNANDIYVIPADGTGRPRVIVPAAWSPALVP